jgi:outer membrane protein assembly factor BamE (lipoprotein component of BamABCDE complex)
MSFRNLRVAAALAVGLIGLAGGPKSSRAETIAVDNGIAVKESDVVTPSRGMTMNQVAAKFGAPVSKIPAVGNPPISRWDYPGFVVYFEREHVIHSVVANS